MSQPLPPPESLPPLGPRRPATAADLEGVPSNYTGHILQGRLYAFPRPHTRHSFALSRLDKALTVFDEEAGDGTQGPPGGWWLLVEPELHLRSDILVPDLAGWRRERLAALPNTPFIATAPDWVCEVLSPSTEEFDRGAKAEAYARHGVAHFWVVDPEARTLEVFAREGLIWRPAGSWQGATAIAAAPFAVHPWPLARLWL